MKDKDRVLKIVLSTLLIISGVLLLLDQLRVKYIDEYFTPWYLVVILFFIGCLFAYAIIRKAPVFYVLAMLLAGIYLVISLHFKGVNYTKVLFIIPLFIGLGFIMADMICKWSAKALRFGFVVTVASGIILVSSILDVWRIVIPIVLILVGIAYVIFAVLDAKRASVKKEDDHYVTYQTKEEKDDAKEKTDINSVDD